MPASCHIMALNVKTLIGIEQLTKVPFVRAMNKGYNISRSPGRRASDGRGNFACWVEYECCTKTEHTHRAQVNSECRAMRY